MDTCSNSWRRAALTLVLVLPGAAGAQELAWRAPIRMELPSATDLHQQVLVAAPDGVMRLVIATAWSGMGSFGAETTRVIAIDPSSGERLWQRDLDASCVGPHQDVGLVAAFPNGDVAVATVARAFIGGSGRSACYARLDGRDGHVVWSHVDGTAQSDDGPIRVAMIAVDANGDVVATGQRAQRMRTIKLAGFDGSRLWTREADEAAGASGGVAITGSATGDVLAVMQNTGANGAQRTLLAFDDVNGQPRWARALCAQSIAVNELRAPRALADGSIIVLDHCELSGADHVSAMRLARSDGQPLWQRQIPVERVALEIDPAGDVILAGAINVDGVATGLLRLAATDARVLWSVPGVIGEVPAPDSATLAAALGNGSVYTWEMIGNRYSIGVYTTRLSRYDAAGGQLLGRVDVTEPAIDYLARNGRVQPLPGGDVLLDSVSLYPESGRWIWLGRVRPADGALDWVRREPVAASQPLDLVSDMSRSGPTLLASTVGVPGVVVGGRATVGELGDADTYPGVAKVAQDDGRVVWRWQPDAVLPGSADVAALATDAVGHLLVVGHATDRDSGGARLLAKLDAATGRALWQRLDPDAEALTTRTLALDAAGDPFVLSTLQLARHAGADGQLRWRLDIPGGTDLARDARLVINTHGEAIVASPYSSGSENGLQIAKFDGGDGALRWLRRLSMSALPRLTILASLRDGDVVVAAPDENEAGLVARVRGDSGDIAWQRHDLRAAALLADPQNGVVIAATAGVLPSHDELTRLDAEDGSVLWRRSLAPGSIEHVTRLAAGADGSVFVAGIDGAFRIIAAGVQLASGHPQWQSAALSGDVDTPVGIVRGGDGAAYLAANQADTGNQPRTAGVFKFIGAFTDPVFANGFD